jgi:hypothetical protein
MGLFLQVAGLIILPIGFSYGMFRDEVRLEVRLLFFGALLFLVGRAMMGNPK